MTSSLPSHIILTQSHTSGWLKIQDYPLPFGFCVSNINKILVTSLYFLRVSCSLLWPWTCIHISKDYLTLLIPLHQPSLMGAWEAVTLQTSTILNSTTSFNLYWWEYAFLEVSPYFSSYHWPNLPYAHFYPSLSYCTHSFFDFQFSFSSLSLSPYLCHLLPLKLIFFVLTSWLFNSSLLMSKAECKISLYFLQQIT